MLLESEICKILFGWVFINIKKKKKMVERNLSKILYNYNCNLRYSIGIQSNLSFELVGLYFFSIYLYQYLNNKRNKI